MATGDSLEALSSCNLFDGIDEADLRGLAAELEPVELAGGETLISEGEQSDALFILVTGRLRATRRGADDDHEHRGDISPGQVVGEMALLGGRPRTATVRAVRDSTLVRLSSAAFRDFSDRRPDVLRRLALTILDRADDSAPARLNAARVVRTVAIVPAGDTSVGAVAAFAGLLATALQRFGSVTTVSAGRADDEVGNGAGRAEAGGRLDGEVRAWLHRVERANRFALYLADATASPWTRRCLRQADRVLLVGTGRGRPSIGPAESGPGAPLARHDLILLHRPGTAPEGTEAWLSPRSVVAHQHIVEGRTADHERLARGIAGRAVGVVLGGGGPRGFAHLGALRALEDAGVPIDSLGGTSIGAVIAGATAKGWDHQQRTEALLQAFSRTPRLFGFTLPLVSVSSGRTLTRLLRDPDLAGASLIEDLWLPYFCISADLHDAAAVIHDRGPLWRAVRASTSLPGVFPPLSSNGHLLVDGGVVNNLPVDVMADRNDGPVVAVDLEVGGDLPPVHDLPAALSGWSLLARRLLPSGRGLQLPNTLELLLRAKDISTIRARRSLLEAAPPHLLLRPDIGDAPAFDFSAGEALVERGYEWTRRTLADTDLTDLTRSGES